MNTQLAPAPLKRPVISIAIRRQLIIEIACKEFKTTSPVLRKMSTKEKFELPWCRLCGIIGYLLRNTDASDRQIAELIDCDRFDVAMFVRDVSRALDTETIVSGDGINATLNTILSEVQTELASDKFPQLSGSVLRFPTKHQVRSDFATEAERIVDGVMTIAARYGFLPKSLKETGQKPDIVRVRDVFFFLLAARTNLTYPKIGSLLDRGISQVASSVFRFRNPDEARRQLLGEVCEYMGINAQEMLAWKGRKDRD